MQPWPSNIIVITERTVKRYYEAGTKGEVEQIKKRQSSAPLLLSGFEEIIKDK
ncbi:hypothetical protein SAMN04487821_12186, partial [Enterococcus malodoratus]